MAQFILSAFADEASKELKGQIAALQRNGIDCLEPRSIEGSVIKKTDAELRSIRKELDTAGIRVPSLGSPIGKYDIDQPFDAHLKQFRRALEVCHLLGADKMRIFSFFVPQDRLAECRAEVIRRMCIMVAEANEAGITLCHENESDIYGQNPPELCDLYENVPGLRGIFDAANLVRNGQDPVAGFEATLPVLEYLHVKDACFADGVIVPVGMGDGAYPALLRRLDAMTDRTIQLTLEPHLHIFDLYKNLDRKELKNLITYDSADDAFDAAASALRNLLTGMGFVQTETDGGKVWKKA